MDIIITHVNADFDALASTLAASKLYPEARIVFPGSKEKNLRNFFIQSSFYMLDILKIKDVDMDKITRLILVDVRSPSRIGVFADLIKKGNVKVHIYDHHQFSKGDIKGDYENIQIVGATTSILVELLVKKKIPITPAEATVMALGIYEDTGAFTFTSTTPLDFKAASHLLEMGCDLTVVSDIITRELTSQQIGLLNDLLQSVTIYHVNRIDIAVTTASLEYYMGDLAVLVHKMIDIKNYNVLFALVRMEDKVYMVARSRLQEINVGVIASEFGGGGHSSAASATIKNMPLAQVRERLLENLQSSATPVKIARELMSFPVKYIVTDTLIADASEFMVRYNINVLPVVDKEGLKGIISRQVVHKAMHHGLNTYPVNQFMSTDFEIISPDAPLSEIQSKIVDKKQRFLPVVSNGELAGVVTRTDLMQILINDHKDKSLKFQNREINRYGHSKNLSGMIKQSLPPHIYELLKEIGELAEKNNYIVYVVGGFVRDLILKHENLDIDIVVEGDGIGFARILVNHFGGRMRHYYKFGTAVVIFPDNFKIDVATARTEYYDHPAALPVVETSSIKLDLYRRDFTINAIALELTPPHFGIMLDFFTAQRDFKDKAIRVLHNLSLVEDPTRAFRAIRFEQRFGFKIGKHTENLIKNAVKNGFFERLSGQRIFNELKLILSEDTPCIAISRMKDFGLLPFISKEIKFDKRMDELFNRVKAVLHWYELSFLEKKPLKWQLNFFALIYRISDAGIEKLTKDMMLPGHVLGIIKNDRQQAQKCLGWFASHKKPKNSELYCFLSKMTTLALLFAMSRTTSDDIRKFISLYFTRLRNIKTELKGRDLRDMGIMPGPIYSKLLSSVLDAKLNNSVKTRDDEIKYLTSLYNREKKKTSHD